MIKMREVSTPLKLFKIRYYKDENGLYYKKIGKGHRRQVKPFWKMKRVRLGVPIVILLVAGFSAYQIGMDMASKKVVEEFSAQIPEKEIKEILKSPDVQDIIEKEIGTEKKQEVLQKYSVETTQDSATAASVTGTGEKSENQTNKISNQSQTSTSSNQPAPKKDTSKLQFKSRDEVMKFLLSKFSMGELKGFAKKAEGGITAEEKAEIKNAVLQRLTQEEYNALKVYGILEMSKGNI